MKFIYLLFRFFEPIVLGTIITPGKGVKIILKRQFELERVIPRNFTLADVYVGPIMSLAMDRRGVQVDSKNIDESRVMMQFKLPLNEIAVDFYDALKSLSSGYASFDYEEDGFQESDIVKVIFLASLQ